MRPRQNGRHFADDIFKCIFLNENVWIPIKISLKFVPKGPINNIPSMVQIMARRRPGDKPLSEPMVASLPTHICVARPQWVELIIPFANFNGTTVEVWEWKSNFIQHFSGHLITYLYLDSPHNGPVFPSCDVIISYEIALRYMLMDLTDAVRHHII